MGHFGTVCTIAARARRRLAPVVMLLFMALPGAPLVSQEPEQEERLGDRETRETAAMSEAVYKEIAKAQEAADAEKYSEAKDKLGRLLKRTDLTSYERIQALNLLAFIQYSEDRYSEAITTYESVLQEEGVTKAIRAATTFNLAQLYSATENWQKTVEMLDKWFAMPGVEPQASHLVLRGQAHYQLGNFRMVVASMQEAINMATSKGQKVNEQWYVLLRVAYQELGMHTQVARILEELIRKHPAESYWLQLAAAYGQAGDERRQLQVMDLAHLQGFLDKEPEIMAYFGTLMNGNLPYRAGKLLEKAIEDGTVESNVTNWRYLAQAWRLAQEDEKAIPALTKAADLSSDGKDHLVLAQSYMNLEDWPKAAAAVRKAIAKGLERPDEAYVLLGQALFYADQFEEAREAFEKAQADQRSRRLATQWLTYIENEVERRQQLAAAIEE